MSRRRLARLNEQFKREISDILRRDVRDPRIGTPTVTAVDVTTDLWLARVYVRPGPETAPQGEDAEFMEALEQAAPFIRKAVGQGLNLRRIPELRFELDRTLEQAMRIEEILREVLPEDAREPPEPASEAEGTEGAGE